MAAPSETEAIAATERWFTARGLPHFIFRYSASRDVWTRAVPLLTLVALGEVAANAPSDDFPVWGSVLACVLAFAAVLGVWAVANRLRHRPLFARPENVGLVEVAMFVVVPALVPIIASSQWRSGVITGGANVLLLALIYVTTSYGVVPMARWAVGHGARQVLTVSGVLVRALPLLLLVVIVVFYTTEPAQIAHALTWPLIAVAVGFFLLVATLFAAIRVPGQVGELAHAESWAVLKERTVPTPAGPLARRLPSRPPEPPLLSRKEWLNVGLVVLATEAILVLLVGAAMFGFLVILGTLTVPPDLMHTWIGEAPDALVSFNLFDTKLAVTSELLKTASFLAGFSALQFTVALLSDGTQQEEFLHQLREEMRESLAARAVYLTAAIRRART
ncbi:MAG: hypothetical protein EXQ79_02575 [Acidimicrobiia bacterium]|nr:hypothetical protein [Acidimicrobiia bacterium]